MMNLEKLGGVGASEVGKLFTKEGVKSKTAMTMTFEKAKELIFGYKKNITTIAMQHGLFNEEEAFFEVVKPCFPNSTLRSSDSVWINDNLWATPDVTDDVEGITLDIKCPYTIRTFFKNIDKLPATYIAQNQCQMLATGHRKGMFCIYLTSNQIDEFGNKIEYEIDINKRHRFIPLDYQEEYGQEIVLRVDDFLSNRDIILGHLSKANELSDLELFDLHLNSKVTRFQDKSNLLAWEGKIVRNGTDYYVKENK